MVLQSTINLMFNFYSWIADKQPLWLAFSIIFLCLAGFHFRLSKNCFKEVKNEGHVKTFNGIALGVVEVVSNLNSFITNLNNENKKMNIAAAIGYLIAMLTSIYSFYIS